MKTETKAIQKLKYDGVITIATGRNRKETRWKNKEMLWSELLEKFSSTTRTRETYEEYKKLSKSQQDDIKDVGGFVGGTLKDGRRKTENVVLRQVITLDADFVKGDLWASVETILGCGCAMYSTHKHNPENPRLRLVIPLNRPVTPDEYGAISRRIAGDLGIDFFDDTTYQPQRLMYWPSTSQNGEFLFNYLDELWLNPDEVLARYPGWRDSSYWPEASRTKIDRKKLADKQGDPREKAGVIGAFCRTYTVVDAIEKFLSGIYVPSEENNRYTYVKGSTAGGLVIYENGDFTYSHHGTDPASGKLCNAFDLVRLHKFGDLDEDVKEGTPVVKLPSYKAMVELAASDGAIKKKIAEERMSEASDDFNLENDWIEGLEINAKGELKGTLTNMVLIIRHDPSLDGIAYNEHRDSIDVREEVPWKRLKEGWGKADEAGLSFYLENKYKIWSPGKFRDAILKVAVERSFHPVRKYLEALSSWDGIERVDTLLINYLGAEDNVYVRAATRKILCAAVARVIEPGVKFDTMLVLNGPQGIGKSTLFSKLAGKWFSDSLSISDMKDKTAAEKLQGYWIMEIGELAGIKKMDVETVKSFLSRGDDKYRASYGYNVESHPRQCIIVGSTNNENGFLRDPTGNRRFWPVKVIGNSKGKAWELKDVDQIWAEALEKYRAGEELFMGAIEINAAEEAQIEALESDEREGLIREYLEKLLPDNWSKMSTFERRSFLRGDEFNDNVIGAVRRHQVCIMEIWCELFGKDASTLKRQDAYELNAMMRKIEGWEKYSGNSQGNAKVPNYGIQRIYVRKK